MPADVLDPVAPVAPPHGLTEMRPTDPDLLLELLGRHPAPGELRRLLRERIAEDPEGLAARLEGVLARAQTELLVSRRLADELSLEVLVDRVAETLAELLASEQCTIFLHDPRTGELYTRATAQPGMGDVRFPSDRGIAGRVFTTGQPHVVDDAYADPGFQREVDQTTGFRTRSVLAVPLRHRRDGRSETLGVVEVLNKREGRFTVTDRALLEAVVAQAASSLANARLHDEIARAREEERQLLEVTSVISSELQLEPLLRKVMELVRTILDAEKATIFMHDPRRAELWTLVSGDAAMKEVRFPSSQGIAGSTFTTGETINIPDAYADPRFNPEIDRRTSYRTRTILCMPIVNKERRRLGVMQVLNRRGGPFRRTDEERLRAFCAQAAIAIENAQLFAEVVRTKNYIEGILQSISTGVVSTDGEGRVVTANRAALKLLRAPDAGALAGRTLLQVLGEANAWIHDMAESVGRSGRREEALDAPLALPAKEGDRPGAPASASVNVAVLPLAAGGGAEERAGSIVTIEDITTEKRLRGTLARYMNKELADRLLEEGEAALGGKMQKATVVFTDIRGFTTLSEHLGPQETVKLLNEYFGIMADLILERGGILDKYIGDAIMAVFGVPFGSDDDADRSVETGIEMLRALRGFNAARAAAGRDPVLMGVGINTGEVVSGNIGSVRRMDYTVIGDGVNLASRLEGATKGYGSPILVSEFTKADLRRPFRLRESDRIRVKGKNQPVAVFEVLDHLAEELPGLDGALAAYDAAYARYRAREWDAARAGFARVLELWPGDATSRLHRDRCAYYLEHPPAPDWDGAWTMKEK